MKILLLVSDNCSYTHVFPMGLAYIATYLRKAGHDLTVYSQDQMHWDESHLTKYFNKNDFDAVCVSLIAGYHQYRKIIKISEAIHAADKELYYVLGGYGPSPEPEFFLRKTGADVIVRGEGEVTAVELFESITNPEKWPSIDGLAFFEGGKNGSKEKCIITKERQLIQEVDKIDYPAWDLFPVDYYAMLRAPNASDTDRVFQVLSGRGCPFLCNFCYRMDKGSRIRSSESIIEEIKLLQSEYAITYIIFADDLLMVSKERTIELCQAIIDADLNIKWWCNGRLNYATNEILELMKASGCVFVNYGIESLDLNTLKVMKKGLSHKMIIDGVENTNKVGISAGLNFIYGNIDEPKEAIQDAVDFLIKYDDHTQLRTIRPVTPYPGSPLYYYAIKKGLLEGPEDFYERKHLNSDLLAVNFTKLTDEEFHEELLKANGQLIDKFYAVKKARVLDYSKKLYSKKILEFRGFRDL